jgi:putative membrane protein
MFLSHNDKQSIAARVADLEKALGIEVVTLVIGKADVYPETVWKAFALGAALTALAMAIGEVLRPDWVSVGAVLSAAVTILGIGALCALASVYVPGFARLFLRDSRATLEVSQYAKVQFLERELFATRERTAILVLVSILERRVVIVADTGLRAHVSTAEWNGVIARMTERLAAGEVGAAMLAGLDALQALLGPKGIARNAGNTFADGPLEERGA